MLTRRESAPTLPQAPVDRKRLSRRVDFAHVNSAALVQLPALLARWLPDGRFQGDEYVALNPNRLDRHLGSFKINMKTGRWADFATNDKGGDVISLLAYLSQMNQRSAALTLAKDLGLNEC